MSGLFDQCDWSKMINVKVKTVCDKCRKEVDGKYYKVSVNCAGGWRYSQMQMPKYLSYDICPECMKDVITDDVVGSKSMTSIANTPSFFA